MEHPDHGDDTTTSRAVEDTVECGETGDGGSWRAVEESNTGDDPDDPQSSLFQAAQSQLLEEMMAAGLAGSLPMSFGNAKRQSASSTRSNRKRRREALEQELRRYNTSAASISPPPIVSVEPNKLEKVHVKYDSDGEVAERVVEEVELLPEAAEQDLADVDGQEEQEEDADIVHDAEEARSSPIAGIAQQEIPPKTSPILKFWKQRKHLFYRYEEGILLDHESWYSVTPQAIAEHIAGRLKCDIVVDPFAGCGGNVIQLAMVCKHVIAIDIDPEKIRMAKHNAKIYGVADKVEWIVGNSVDILPTLKADVVFLSPPWGGLDYSRDHFRLDEMVVKGVSGVDLFAKARQVTKNIAYYLPKTTPAHDLEALAPEELVECERMFLNRQLKVVTAYYGELARPSKGQQRKQVDADSSAENRAAAAEATEGGVASSVVPAEDSGDRELGERGSVEARESSGATQ